MAKTTIALLALVATSPIYGFTITMSSYLDKIASGQAAGLTSFAPSQNSYGSSSYSFGSSPAAPVTYANPTPAPAQSTSYSYGGSAAASSSYSYGGSPAPAPTPAYVNAFAHIQPNNSLNYIGTLGGGSAKKWGQDYSGVSSTFRPTYSVGNAAYLDNLKDKVFTLSQPQSPPPVSSTQSSYSYDPAAWMTNSAPAASPSYNSYGGSAAPAPAPSNQSYSYGGSAATPAYSYGGSPTPAPADQSYSYGGSAPTPAYSYGGSSAPASTNQGYSYGGSATPSYSAPAASTAPKSTSSYLESL